MENSNDEYRIYCFAEPEYELGHNGKRLGLHKGKKFVWKIEGYIPEWFVRLLIGLIFIVSQIKV